MDMFRKKDEKPQKISKERISQPRTNGSDGSVPWNRAFQPQAYGHNDSAQGNTGGVSSQSNLTHGDQAPHGFSSDTQYARAEAHNHASSSFSPIASPHRQANRAPPRPARPQQPFMNASMAGQSSATGMPTSQDHTLPTKRNSGSPNPSRPSSAHVRAPSVNAPPNNTAVISQRNSRGSLDSNGSRHSSPPSSSDENPFKYHDGRYDSILK
ncbi:uncharacterized protein Bfra_004547 [Botrytis fragariae]|uniref:Uncharacterized protein n=1 Tax=Botrytis fragariae TaxID=1964551 RepID=A0A8H6AVU4_9HELO|nr:uncharacterized protein Bfra_004547 [Botrytis fragariae]KAF5874536.1 hypothetical protein Bfra_004547 [Botrytis fragariae]